MKPALYLTAEIKIGDGEDATTITSRTLVSDPEAAVTDPEVALTYLRALIGATLKETA